MSDKLTHIAEDGTASMVDVGGKDDSVREATATGSVRMQQETLNAILQGDIKKGDVLGTARLAGIMAAKQTANLIPLCHSLMLSKVSVDIEPDHALPGLRVTSVVKLTGKTGVEMEALTACSIACLTIYDMAKAIDKAMEICDIKLLKKTGGKSGTYIA